MPSICYDKNEYWGGHTATFTHSSGFLFDDGPHVSFTKDERIQELLANSVRDQFEYVQMRVDNYWRGYRMKHPVQCNLYGLPTDLVTRIIVDFVEAPSASGENQTYADWLYAGYGTTFAETFPMVYGLKYHTTTADNMTTEWLGPRMYRPTLQEVVAGALAPSEQNVHYVTEFRYPTLWWLFILSAPFRRDQRPAAGPRTGRARCPRSATPLRQRPSRLLRCRDLIDPTSRARSFWSTELQGTCWKPHASSRSPQPLS